MLEKLKNKEKILYRSDIDGLRGIAIILVVIFHYFPSVLPGGFIGVDIFFVVSGYLITSILLCNASNNEFSLFIFYSNRIRRIFPALIIVLASSLIFGWYSLFASEFQQLGLHTFASSIFIQNFVLQHGTGYFDSASELKPLLHLWSLSIEEQFYLIFPVFLLILWRNKLNIFVFILSALALSFAYNIYQINNTSLAFFYPHTRIWEILAGSLLACRNPISHKFREIILISDPIKRLSWERIKFVAINLLAITSIFVLVCSSYYIDKSMKFPDYIAILPIILTMTLISIGENSLINKKILSNSLLVKIGLVSFPLYLWHWPLLSFAKIIKYVEPSPSIKVFIIMLSGALAWITYWFLELPIRKQKSFLFSVLPLVFLMTGIGLSGLIIFKERGFPSRQSVAKYIERDRQFEGMIGTFSSNSICKNRYPSERMEKIFDKYHYFFCIINKDENPNLLLLGNSFANHLYAGFANNQRLNSNVILSYGICDAPIAYKGNKGDYGYDGEDHPCSLSGAQEEQNFIADIIQSSKTIEYAIISGLDNKPSEKYISRLLKRLDFLNAQNIKVIIFIPHTLPPPNFGSIKGCFSRPFVAQPQHSCIFSNELHLQTLSTFNNLILQVKAKYPKVLFFDQNTMYCNDKECNLIKKDLPLFRDSHLSEFGSIEMANTFSDWAIQNAPNIISKQVDGPFHAKSALELK